ncbi:MAG: DNA-processing protein DprA [Ruminococcus sp.]|nr:DNA-processing protein DprA [Ruminococcus sp.]
MEDVKYMFWLNEVFGHDTKVIKNVLEIFPTAEGAYHDITFGSVSIRLTNLQQRAIKKNPISLIEEKIARYREAGISVTATDQPDYPKSLKYLFSPPTILYYKGNISCVEKKNVISCVGTRNPSGYTVSVAGEICRSLAEKGYIIVSGFAVGTDITCHLSAVNIGRPTACVLGCGINVSYPAENAVYKEKILESGGVFISEFEPWVKPYPQNFHRRNRILSALSKAVVVFEASERSGSIITANIAVEQGKMLFVAPPSDIFDKRYRGNINLLKDCAVPVYDVNDITDFFDSYRPASPNERRQTDINAEMFPARKAEKERKISASRKFIENFDKDVKDIEPEEETATGDGGFVMSESQKKIMEVLKTNMLHKDVIIKMTNADINEIALDLIELEIRGYVKSLPGNLFERR